MSHDNELSTIPRKERERKTREREILLAARALFTEKGYHNTTLDEIAHKAEFAKGTIYNYFANKDELFVGIIDDLFDELVTITRTTMALEGADVRAKFTAYAKAIIVHSMERLDLFRLIMQEAPRPSSAEFGKKLRHFKDREKESRSVIARILAAEIDAGTLRSSDPMELAFLFDGMLRFHCMHTVKGMHPMTGSDIDHAVELMVAVFFDGITHRQRKMQ